MKKICALALILGLALSFVCAAAEPYAFYNGVRWGMSVDEVVACEEGEYKQYINESLRLTEIGYENQRISKFTGMKGYAFADDSLVFLIYAPDTSDEKAITYLKGALSSLYGEPTVFSINDLLTFIHSFGSPYSEEDISQGSQWSVGDDTTIWLCYMQNDPVIIYINNQFDFSMLGVYDTTGL